MQEEGRHVVTQGRIQMKYMENALKGQRMQVLIQLRKTSKEDGI